MAKLAEDCTEEIPMELKDLSPGARVVFLDTSVVLYEETGKSFNDALRHAQTMSELPASLQEEVARAIILARNKLFPSCDNEIPLSREAGRAVLEFIKQESPPLKPDSHKYDLP